MTARPAQPEVQRHVSHVTVFVFTAIWLILLARGASVWPTQGPLPWGVIAAVVGLPLSWIALIRAKRAVGSELPLVPRFLMAMMLVINVVPSLIAVIAGILLLS